MKKRAIKNKGPVKKSVLKTKNKALRKSDLKVKKKVVKKTIKKVNEKDIPKTKKVRKAIIKKINVKSPKQIKDQSKTTLRKFREKNRVSTGIKNLDELIEGGFTKNSTNLVVGSGGSGKSIFGVQFLVEGLKQGEKGLYITFEEKKAEFYEHMKGLGYDLENLEKKGQFFFVEYTPAKVKKMLEEGGGFIETLILRKKIQRVVIDSISAFALLFESDIEKRESSLALFNLLSKWNCTSVLTYEEHLSMNKKVDFPVLEFESDAIVILYFIRKREERERYLEILKMRGTNHSKKVHEFNIEKDGIVVHPENVSNIQDLYSDELPM